MFVGGARIKEIRKDHGDTQEELAKTLGVTVSTVSKWEQGTAAPSLKCLVHICRMYNVTSDYLLGLSDEDPFLTKRRREKLRDESKTALRLFEEYLRYRDQNQKK